MVRPPSSTSIEGELEIVSWPKLWFSLIDRDFSSSYWTTSISYWKWPKFSSQATIQSPQNCMFQCPGPLGDTLNTCNRKKINKKIKHVLMHTCIFYWLYISTYQHNVIIIAKTVELVFTIYNNALKNYYWS